MSRKYSKVARVRNAILIPSLLVPDDTRNLYLRHIDAILQSSDLQTISAKQIRRQLDDRVDHDIAPHKVSDLTSLYPGLQYLQSL